MQKFNTSAVSTVMNTMSAALIKVLRIGVTVEITQAELEEFMGGDEHQVHIERLDDDRCRLTYKHNPQAKKEMTYGDGRNDK